jgi:hypothetical protein
VKLAAAAALLAAAGFVITPVGATPCVATPLRAQNGDVKDEVQPPLREEWRVPAPKALSPEEELATFALDDGLRVELVAAEPLVRDPVCASFDERGRLWVCEMSGFMPDVDAHGESEPKGSVVVLSDRDGDGRMDERTLFLDASCCRARSRRPRGGALVIAPPNLIFARDTDGDGRADDVRIVDNGLQGIASPEHAINGLLPTLDNWFACANAPVRYRWRDGTWERGRTAGGGQWGITEDRWGRIFYDDNSNPLRCDLYPSQYAVRNPNLGVAPGMGVNIAKGARPHPSHMTPGVNRGYRNGVLGRRPLERVHRRVRAVDLRRRRAARALPRRRVRVRAVRQPRAPLRARVRLDGHADGDERAARRSVPDFDRRALPAGVPERRCRRRAVRRRPVPRLDPAQIVRDELAAQADRGAQARTAAGPRAASGA